MDLHDHNFFLDDPVQPHQPVHLVESSRCDHLNCDNFVLLDQIGSIEPQGIHTGTELTVEENCSYREVNQVGLVVEVLSEILEEVSSQVDSPASLSPTHSGIPFRKRKFNIYAEGIGLTLEFLSQQPKEPSRPSTPQISDVDETPPPTVPLGRPKEPPRSNWSATKSGKKQGGGGSHSGGNYSSQRGASEEMRQLMRKKMHRCTICKNRFIERDLFERHMKERHPKKFEVYMEEKNKREEKERLEYLEFLRIQREKEERRNQRLAEIYEERLKLAAEGHNVGPPPMPEDIFPQRAPRPKSPPDEDVSIDVSMPMGDEDVARFRGINIRNSVRFNKKVSPQCPFCDKRYRNDNSLRKHIAKKHPDCINFVQCNRCYKALRNADEIPGHQCDLTYICNECQPVRNMVDAERLYNHKQKFHRGEKSGFLCTECNRKFLTPRKLKKHQRMAHVIQKPYKCQFCDEYFPTDMQVCAHERIHTGKVRWECPMCDYRCNRSTKLLDHKKNEHGYLCMLCGEPQPEWNNLKNHTLEKHQGYLSSENQNCVIVSPRIWTLLKGE